MVAFGTDGVRGRAYDELTLSEVACIGAAVVEALGASSIAVGRDPRESGPDFLAALAAGISARGAHLADLGVAPTPVVAQYSAAKGIPGIVVSASHNPYYDNGLKVFGPGGLKLDDETEASLEAAIQRQTLDLGATVADPDTVIDVSTAAAADYIRRVKATIAPRDLGGLSVVVDAANGAASHLAGTLLERLGARVTVIHASPDGRNINEACGSTDPRDLIAAVQAEGAACGIALDGDADRLVAVAGDGGIVDGDHVIAICAIDRHERNVLVDNTVVVTVMANLGFRQAMAARGIAVHETPVGDRHVLAALERNGWTLGGEQSGHVIFRDLATTGDGLLTAVQLLDVVARTGEPLAELSAAAMTRLPQVLHNVQISGDAAGVVADLASRIEELQADLGDSGRVLVRPSGTEPLIRVMVEAQTEAEAQDLAQRIVSWI